MRFSFVLLPLVLAAAPAVNSGQDLAQVQSVYILPMANGVDQYLASNLTRAGVFRVVTDPTAADAIFTENVGPGFEAKMKELYPPPAPPPAPAPPPEAKAEAAKDDKDKAKEKDDTLPALGDLKDDKDPREAFRPKISPWVRGKGTLFLVGRQSRTVIWSSFDKPKDSRPKTLDQMAQEVVKRLMKDLGRQ